jgi:hypothetical protein
LFRICDVDDEAGTFVDHEEEKEKIKIKNAQSTTYFKLHTISTIEGRKFVATINELVPLAVKQSLNL